MSINNQKKKLHQTAVNVIDTEIKSLRKLKTSIKNKSFLDAVKAIIKCKNGKVILSGVGKSGIIARKISATFSSTGTPSFFLDANDASHGDMGQIGSNDILILISLSGETNELKNIIEFTSRKKIILIGITSKKESLLYKNSDIKLLLPKVIEAGPGNIVPTSSTIIQLSLGDALAVSCMQLRNFGKLDFKKFHPGGTLSIKLKTVEDLMLKGKKIPFINENQILKNAIKIISNKKLGVLIVIKTNNKVSGIITDGDIRRLLEKEKNIWQLKAKEVMSSNPKTVQLGIMAADALKIMTNFSIMQVIIVDEKNRPRGIIHLHDILEAGIL